MIVSSLYFHCSFNYLRILTSFILSNKWSKNVNKEEQVLPDICSWFCCLYFVAVMLLRCLVIFVFELAFLWRFGKYEDSGSSLCCSCGRKRILGKEPIMPLSGLDHFSLLSSNQAILTLWFNLGQVWQCFGVCHNHQALLLCLLTIARLLCSLHVICWPSGIG